MRRRVMWCVLAGFSISVFLHLATAVSIAYFPYRDVPLAPSIIFVYLLLPGWLIAGRAYHVVLWQEALAALINGVFYSMVFYFFVSICVRPRRDLPHAEAPAKYTE